jgi:predicted adenine nucleotide alpha hydrolase (AANH) superfamily ATPase
MQNKIKLVLLSCCAPCSCGAIKQLADGEFPEISDFIVLFYNPNIYPEPEYQKRLAEQVRYCESLGVKYEIGLYDHDAWLSDIRGLESEPERGARCAACFKHRFKFAQKFALANGYNAIASVFGVSRHKSQPQVDQCAADVLTEIKYLPIHWDNELKCRTERGADFYRQNYCGCEFSMRK